ncbi:MAG: elongation factor P [Planctomycetota bacterium]|nr:elongation factor P [Planctomycetota bacterium]
MPTMKLRDVKVGEAILHRGEVWIVFDRHEQTRGNLRTYWQVKLKNLEKGNVYEERFSPDDNVEKVILNKAEAEYLYRDGKMLVFMDPESYDQISVPEDMVPEPQRPFLVPNMRATLLKLGDRVVQVEMPQTVTVEVTDAPDGARGDTATNVTKVVTIETGAQVRVPGYIKKGEKVKIRVEDGEFLGRA